jgi:tetratricopeptide (TPR) repeat protein
MAEAGLRTKIVSLSFFYAQIRQNRAKSPFANRKLGGNEKMKVRIARQKIPKTVRGQLPVIPIAYMKERGCTYCPYYAGSYLKRPRCMLATCGWDRADGRFHPALRQMIPQFRAKAEKTKAKYETAQNDYEVLLSMFSRELAKERSRQDECYECCYGKGGPCIGVCYKTLTEKGGQK